MTKWIRFCSLILIAPTLPIADTKKIKIPIPDEAPINAIFSSPNEKGKYPAIVYMHGGAVRERGNPVYKPNGTLLFDINDKIKDMSSMGIVVLAPLRNTVADCCNGDNAVREGISIAKSSVKYLRSLPYVLKDKVCLLGFSEGALISMWAMTEPNDYSKAIIMSPSNQCGMRRAESKNYCLSNLVQFGKLENVKKNYI
jgi:dipeptidyl aminopeptidase/acylaminoacyl peptidase